MSKQAEQIVEAVRAYGLDVPALVIDADAVRANAGIIRENAPGNRLLRIADKSLPAPWLIRQAMDALNTRAFMSFHLPLTAKVLELCPDADILMGKPLPTSAAARFTKEHAQAVQVTWLVDSGSRLAEFRALADQIGTKLRIALEVDIGLGRGGLQQPDELANLLQDAGSLTVEGIMGYEAHVNALPKLLGGGKSAQADAMRQFSEFANMLGPDQRNILNTAGSTTLLGLGDDIPANDLTVGSLLVKPTGFDQTINHKIRPAMFVATPVLKTHPHGIPGNPRLSAFLRRTGIIRDQIAFGYGGKWMAKPVFPPGLKLSPFFGESSNQQGYTLPRGTAEPEYIILRPTQSEAIIQHFPQLLIMSGGKITSVEKPWPIL